jgi:hypothetical protein
MAEDEPAAISEVGSLLGDQPQTGSPPEGDPPNAGPPLPHELPKGLAEWWEARWRRYAENRFGVIVRLWLNIQPAEKQDKPPEIAIKEAYESTLRRMDLDDVDEFTRRVEVVQEMLGLRQETISSDTCAKLVAEMDEHRVGGLDNRVDFHEAARWWAHFTMRACWKGRGNKWRRTTSATSTRKTWAF